MNNEYKDGFDRLVSSASDGPDWHDLAHPPASSPSPKRGSGLLVAVSVAVVAAVAVGAVLISRDPSGGVVAAPTVDYVKIAWTQTVEQRCDDVSDEGIDMSVQDNGGFDEATIEIWGPNSEGLVRIDATAPDGTVERTVLRYALDSGHLDQQWTSWPDRYSSRTVFHESACVTRNGADTSTFVMAQSPMAGRGTDAVAFVQIPSVDNVGQPFDADTWLASGGTVTQNEWLGQPVTVYARQTEDSYDISGTVVSSAETWFNHDAQRFERVVYDSVAEHLGSVLFIEEVLERRSVVVDSAFFSTEELFNIDGDATPAPNESSTTTLDPSQPSEPTLETVCGPVWIGEGTTLVLPDTPMDDDAMTAVAAGVAVGAEGQFFLGPEWFIAERTDESLTLFRDSGTDPDTGEPRYSYALFDRKDNGWDPSGWGGCNIETTADGWGTADWVLVNDGTGPAAPSGTTLSVLIQERDCASGLAPIGREILPVIVRTTDRVTITVLVEPVTGGATTTRTCPINPWHPFTITLDGPVDGLLLYNGRTVPAALVWPPSPGR